MKPNEIDWGVKSFYCVPQYTCPFCKAKIAEAGWIVVKKSDKKQILVCFGCGEDEGKPRKKTKAKT